MVGLDENLGRQLDLGGFPSLYAVLPPMGHSHVCPSLNMKSLKAKTRTLVELHPSYGKVGGRKLKRRESATVALPVCKLQPLPTAESILHVPGPLVLKSKGDKISKVEKWMFI